MRTIIFAIVLVVMLLASCAKPGTGVGVDGAQDDFNVEFLFEAEGLRIFRFYDAGDHRYFAVGDGTFLPQEQSRSSGKTSYRYSDGATTHD